MNAAAGARMTVAECLTNLVFAKISDIKVCNNFKDRKNLNYFFFFLEIVFNKK